MRKGFTLFEMLVVIAIIAILAAIMFPVYRPQRHKAQAGMCLENVKRISLAVLTYAQDYDEALPGARGTEWNVALYEYLREPHKTLRCPVGLSTYGLQRKYDPSIMPAEQVMIAETHAVSGLLALPASPHGERRDLANIGFLDGHAKLCVHTYTNTWEQVEAGLYKPILPLAPTQLAAR